MLKFWVLVLNYKCPNQCVFCCFYGFICDFLEFSSVKSFKIFTAQRTQRDTNYKHEKSVGFVKQVFSIFSNLCILPLPKNWFTVSFAFCAHVGVIKYRKTLTFPFEFAQIT